MNFATRKSAWTELKPYCGFAKSGDTVEVTNWTNQEGYDISLEDGRIISITCGEAMAIFDLINALNE